MNPAMLKAMKPKKKRPVDPNAPPRPNLLSHDKTIRDMKTATDSQADLVKSLQFKVDDLENKLRRQTEYLNQLHNYVTSKLKNH
jgi:hypothetical protein